MTTAPPPQRDLCVRKLEALVPVDTSSTGKWGTVRGVAVVVGLLIGGIMASRVAAESGAEFGQIGTSCSAFEADVRIEDPGMVVVHVCGAVPLARPMVLRYDIVVRVTPAVASE